MRGLLHKLAALPGPRAYHREALAVRCKRRPMAQGDKFERKPLKRYAGYAWVVSLFTSLYCVCEAEQLQGTWGISSDKSEFASYLSVYPTDGGEAIAEIDIHAKESWCDARRLIQTGSRMYWSRVGVPVHLNLALGRYEWYPETNGGSADGVCWLYGRPDGESIHATIHCPADRCIRLPDGRAIQQGRRRRTRRLLPRRSREDAGRRGRDAERSRLRLALRERRAAVRAA